MLNELNLTPELLEKAKSATSAEALLALAQENDITLTTEEATAYYTQLHPKEGALSDDELDNVSGGCGDPTAKELAIEYVYRTWCNKPPNCLATQVTSLTKKSHYLVTVRCLKKLCYNCGYRGTIDAHCREMGWPIFESDASIEDWS